MSRSAAKNKRMAVQGLYFVALMHPLVFGVLWKWSGVVENHVIVKVLLMDICFYVARRSEPRYLTVGGGAGREGENLCEDCQVARPPRVMHCKTCKKCIYKWDNHCPLLNGCVGSGNHGKYVLFLAVTTTCLFSLADALFAAVRMPLLSSMNLLPVLLTLIIVVLQAISAGLLTWHLFLILTNQTSPEVLRPEKCFWLNSPSSPTSALSVSSALSNFISWANHEFCDPPTPPSPPPSPRTWSSSV
eukprot:TRINITY_DN1126_c2_g1_i5.p1 TRINITY_DN1126_c2_g1~~TRINITY_DN1126_c2_g1_i5.p1  ORF type:complete len:245 (+),score=41.82 TRINITY_DN1126_c2_g1_i5:506-1240(+)